jgi:hypothetical protein
MVSGLLRQCGRGQSPDLTLQREDESKGVVQVGRRGPHTQGRDQVARQGGVKTVLAAQRLPCARQQVFLGIGHRPLRHPLHQAR